MKKLLFLFSVITLISCSEKQDIKRSFCYWNTSYSSYSFDYDKADSLDLDHLYMRLFDVGWNPYEKKALPIATMWDFSDNRNLRQVTPSIYITNDVVLNSSREQLTELAGQIKKRLTMILDTTEDETSRATVSNYNMDDGPEKDSCLVAEKKIFRERIQDLLIDCDWTLKSKDNYFFLLTEIKKQIPQYQLSATIRLWQYRDFEKAGVPPTDRGLLMCYNMKDPKDQKTDNSIGSAAEMAKYVNHDDYPLKLDAALPIFQWALAYRGGKFLGIVPEDNIDIKSSHFKKRDATHYMFTQDVVLGETYYRNGDEVRIEKVSDAEMEKMIGILRDNVDLNGSKVSFFSWNNSYINDYGIKTICGFYEMFGR